MKSITLMAIGLLLSGSMSLGMNIDAIKEAMKNVTSEEQEAIERRQLIQVQMSYYKTEFYSTILKNCAARNEEGSGVCKNAKVLYDFFVENLMGPDVELYNMLSKQMGQKQPRS